jgi:glucose-1-phosphate thymidylyltransferase
MRGVILAGGKGTRLQKSTSIHNKHLLPVYSSQGAYPMICFPIQTLLNSGCDDILIVSSQEHCGDIIEFLGDGHQFTGLKSLTYKVQDHNSPEKNPVGIASAMKLISGFVKDEIFAVILGDNFFENSFKEEFSAFKETYKKTSHPAAHVFLKDVDDIHRFGCAKFEEGKIVDIIEKPKDPPSNLAVSGLYLYSPDVLNLLPTLKASSRGELEVSHLNAHYVKTGNMTHTIISGFWHDLGTPESMIYGTKWINDNNYKVTIYNDI